MLDVFALVVASSLVIAAISGTFYTGGRGGGVKVALHIYSLPARFVLLLVGVGVDVWAVIDILRKIQ
jgi:hypothetical protein